jgi:hypothetical protein
MNPRYDEYDSRYSNICSHLRHRNAGGVSVEGSDGE